VLVSHFLSIAIRKMISIKDKMEGMSDVVTSLKPASGSSMIGDIEGIIPTYPLNHMQLG
jgi:hypothetical protein